MGKGSSFERQISKKLSLWVSNNERDDIYWRSHSSGARYTIRKKLGKDTEGQDADLTCTSKNPDYIILTDKLSIECKAYKDINFWNFITETKTGVSAFWEQAVNQAEQANKLPVLIAKKNNMPILFFCNNTLQKLIRRELKLKEIIKIEYKKRPIYVYKLEDILKLNYNNLLSFLKNIN